jgi:ElaB/YqjD/DUF883 family membrane-anchored ribosome-binding protein
MANNSKSRRTNESGSGGDDSDDKDMVGMASRVAGKAKDAVKDQLSGQVDKSVNDLEAVAKTLKLASQQLEGNIAAPVIEKLAGGVEQVAKYIEDADVRELLRRAESLGRENPFVFVGVAALIGFAGGRFLHASGRSGASAGESQGRTKDVPRLQAPAASRGQSQSARGGASNRTSAAERRA